MEYRVEKREAFRIVGVSHPLDRELEKNFEAVPRMWGQAAADGTIQRLAELMDSPPMGLLGVSACGDREEWRYFIAVASSQEAGEWETYTVPAATWSLQDLERRIVTEWLPTSGYEYGDAPDIEVYLNADPQNAAYEVWLPVVKKGR